MIRFINFLLFLKLMRKDKKSLKDQIKVVVLDGSHNKHGMTQKLIKGFLEGIRSIDRRGNIKVEIIDLLDRDIGFCRGCNSCTSDKDPINARCTIDDDCIKIKRKALDSDVLVFASPIYEYSVSSGMKRFLERCLTLATFRFGIAARAGPIKGKHGVILCPCGAPFPFNHLMGITWHPHLILKKMCKMFRCSKIHVLFAGGMAANKKTEQKYCKKAYDIGVNIGSKLGPKRKRD